MEQFRRVRGLWSSSDLGSYGLFSDDSFFRMGPVPKCQLGLKETLLDVKPGIYQYTKEGGWRLTEYEDFPEGVSGIFFHLTGEEVYTQKLLDGWDDNMLPYTSDLRDYSIITEILSAHGTLALLSYTRRGFNLGFISCMRSESSRTTIGGSNLIIGAHGVTYVKRKRWFGLFGPEEIHMERW